MTKPFPELHKTRSKQELIYHEIFNNTYLGNTDIAHEIPILCEPVNMATYVPIFMFSIPRRYIGSDDFEL